MLRDVSGADLRRRWLPLLAIAGAVIAADQVAKWLVRDRLALGEIAHLAGVRLHHTRNDGLLGGLVSGAAIPVGIATLALIAAGLWQYGRVRLTWPRTVGAGLLLGGAIGNQTDRLRLGYVTDWIARGDVNAFNLADLAIYVGLGLLALSVLVAERPAT